MALTTAIPNAIPININGDMDPAEMSPLAVWLTDGSCTTGVVTVAGFVAIVPTAVNAVIVLCLGTNVGAERVGGDMVVLVTLAPTPSPQS
jgi:hypothetical protein